MTRLLGYLKLMILLGLLSGKAQALVPMESLLLGDLSEYYATEKADPLNYVFRALEIGHGKVSAEDLVKLKEQLALYRGFYQEGENLDNFCRRRPEIAYPTSFAKEQATRSFIATLQYLTLDLSVRSLARYAKELKFTPTEYQNFTKNLVGSYCSANLSLISLKQLERNMIERFNGENSFVLPTIDSNPLFPENLMAIFDKEKALEKQMEQSLKMFQAACSWGGDAENERLLVPLLRNPAIMSFVIRQLSNQKLEWVQKDNLIVLTKDIQTEQVVCENRICRKSTPSQFDRLFPRAVGTTSVADDLRRLYCSEFRDVDFVTRGQEPKIEKMIRAWTFDEQNFFAGHFMSLVTGIPDLVLYAESFNDLHLAARSSMDRVWDLWSEDQLSSFDRELLYEEPLTFELVDTSQIFNRYQPKFRVSIDVNLGEFDRINQRVGKLRTAFKVKVPRPFMVWATRTWFQEMPKLDEIRSDVIKRLSTVIADDVEQARQSYSLAPWSVPLEKLIAEELMKQINLYQGPALFQDESLKTIELPVEVNFGPYALKYMRYRYETQENERRQLEFENLHKRLREERLGDTKTELPQDVD